MLWSVWFEYKLAPSWARQWNPSRQALLPLWVQWQILTPIALLQLVNLLCVRAHRRARADSAQLVRAHLASGAPVRCREPAVPLLTRVPAYCGRARSRTCARTTKTSPALSIRCTKTSHSVLDRRRRPVGSIQCSDDSFMNASLSVPASPRCSRSPRQRRLVRPDHQLSLACALVAAHCSEHRLLARLGHLAAHDQLVQDRISFLCTADQPSRADAFARAGARKLKICERSQRCRGRSIVRTHEVELADVAEEAARSDQPPYTSASRAMTCRSRTST